MNEISPRLRTAALGLAASLATFVLVAARAELRSIPVERYDGHFYARMALQDGGDLLLAPFRNRVLTPLLVAALPVPVPWGFATVTSVATGATVAIMDRLLRLWFPVRIVWFGLALLAMSPLLVDVADPFRVDSVMAAFAAAILFCLATDRWTWLLVIMPIAALNHELVLVLLIPVLLTAWRKDRIGRGALVALAALAAWWLTHRSGWLVVENDRPNLSDAGHREEMIRWNAARYGSVAGAVWAHAVHYVGILGLLAPFGWRRAPQMIRDATWILVPCGLAVLTASDWGRLFIPALPVLVVLSCAAATRLQGDGPATNDTSDALDTPTSASLSPTSRPSGNEPFAP